MTDQKTVQVLPLKKFMTIEIIAAAIINAAFGMLFGWLVGRTMDSVPFTGQGGIVTDVLVTGFATGLLLTLIVTALLRGRIAKGIVPDVPESKLFFPMGLLPKNSLLRAFAMAIFGVGVLAPLTLLVFWGLKVTHLSPTSFMWIKGLYGAIFGVVFTPLAMMPMMAGKFK